MNSPDTYNIIEIQCMHSSDSARLFVDRRDYDQLREQVEKLTKERDEALNDCLKLIDSVKYTVGIAERIFGVKCPEDQTTDRFVLSQVQRMEQQLAALAEQNEKMRKEPENACTIAREMLNRWRELLKGE